MRVFALSDIHVDYAVNARWIANLSQADHTEDLLILAGDVTDILHSLEWCLGLLATRFRKVLFVPGNHDLWVAREAGSRDSLEKLEAVRAVAAAAGVSMQPVHGGGVSIYPLLSWYDYSFGEPSERLKALWMDYRACRWPEGFDVARVARHFAALNEAHVTGCADDRAADDSRTVITFSHFVPRADLVPPGRKIRRLLHPVLGNAGLDQQLRRYNPSLHVFGHHHINRRVRIDGVTYVNNAFGYPNEPTHKQLVCVHEG
jgi:predicted phosphodiesterase